MQRVGIWAKPSDLPPIWVTLLREEEECSLESCALPLLTGSDPSWLRMTCWLKHCLGTHRLLLFQTEPGIWVPHSQKT